MRDETAPPTASLMKLPLPVNLLYAPADAKRPAAEGLEAAADLVELTDRWVDAAVTDAWWSDERIDPSAAADEIDRYWDWHVDEIEYDGGAVEVARLAVVTGDGAVQGAMLLSSTGVPMANPSEWGNTGLLVEWLFAAPRNRPEILKAADQPIFYGAGSHLIRAAVQMSRERGCSGRLKLDASPRALTGCAQIFWHSLR